MLWIRGGTKLPLAVICVVVACGGTVETAPSSVGGSGATSGSGGTSTGGGSVGGASGSSGASGSGAVGGTGGDGGAPACEEPSDCQIFSDCCSCTAYGLTEGPPPSCLMDCYQDACSSIGMAPGHAAGCEFGRCILGMDCDATHAYCNALPPECGAGMAPTVVDGCWGGCIESIECLTITGCEQCTGPGQFCVTQQADAAESHCVEMPPACEGNVSESCLCPLLCPGWNFCALQSGRLQCDYI